MPLPVKILACSQAWSISISTPVIISQLYFKACLSSSVSFGMYEASRTTFVDSFVSVPNTTSATSSGIENPTTPGIQLITASTPVSSLCPCFIDSLNAFIPSISSSFINELKGSKLFV